MAEIGFEDAMKRIEQIVSDLEKSELPLEEALTKFEEAIKLARLCQKKLGEAEKRVSKLVGSEEAGFSLEPFEEGEE